MAQLSMREMLEAGVHFGHQTNRWNPKMRQYIFGARNGIYIIDLQQTVPMFNKAYQFLVDTVANGKKVLFVGTKRQAQDVVAEQAARAGQYYVNKRWLGGTLTNFRTIRESIDRLRNIEKMEEDGTIDRLVKKERLNLSREREKLERNLGGIKDMTKLPGAIFVVDTRREHIAVAEARKLGIPVVALVDTNCDPDLVDYVVPSNDDAIRAIRIFLTAAADGCAEGRIVHEERLAAAKASEKTEKVEKKAAAGGGGRGGNSAKEPQAEGEEPQRGPKVEVVKAPSKEEKPASKPVEGAEKTAAHP